MQLNELWQSSIHLCLLYYYCLHYLLSIYILYKWNILFPLLWRFMSLSVILNQFLWYFPDSFNPSFRDVSADGAVSRPSQLPFDSGLRAVTLWSSAQGQRSEGRCPAPIRPWSCGPSILKWIQSQLALILASPSPTLTSMRRMLTGATHWFLLNITADLNYVVEVDNYGAGCRPCVICEGFRNIHNSRRRHSYQQLCVTRLSMSNENSSLVCALQPRSRIYVKFNSTTSPTNKKASRLIFTKTYT